FLLWAVCLNVVADFGPCEDLDVVGCRNNPQICQDPLLAEVTCPVSCNKCPTVQQTTTTASTVDRSWGQWGEWSQCSHTCDNGTQSRGRSCDIPSRGGPNCTGPSIQTRGCFDLNCQTADCSDLLKSGRSWPSGVYTMVTWQTHTQVDVFCDMETDGGGWTVFQHRFNGSVDFYRNFSSYENGFGSLHGEFWLGLRLLNELTSRRNNTLRIDLQAHNGTRAYDVYEGFSLGPVSPQYKLPLNHDGLAFTTFDHDRDPASGYNCAVHEHGAWWYKQCGVANLNGRYLVPGTYDHSGMKYNSFAFYISLKESKMMSHEP
ncbi:FCN1-like protein, partial [Mya arenaria]